MRITFAGQFRDTLVNLEQAQEALTKYQQQVSSGRRLNAPSDDPAGTAAAVSAHAELTALDTYASATDTTTARLTVADTALNDIVTQITAAKTTATSVRNSSTTTAQRQAAVASLQGIKQTLVSDLGSTYRGEYIFSGTNTTTAPYTIAGTVVSAYQGNASSAAVDVDRQSAVAVTINGQSITQGSDPQDLFRQIDSLITAVQGGDTAGIDTGIAALDRGFTRAVQVQTTNGTSLKTLDSESLRLSGLKQDTQSRISSLEDANLAESITALEAAQAAKQAALQVAATTNRQTLMDYLK